ncbi:MAG: YraN family protein [Candidatus Zixiibacteriota bacterium]
MPSFKKQTTAKKKTTSIGRRYENLAARFFLDNGYEILQRNWRSGRKEIDLIVKKDHLIAFVEVKAARSVRFGHPAEKVNQKKRENLTQVARQYLSEHGIEGMDLRFDVVTFVDGQIEHFPGAFEATG